MEIGRGIVVDDHMRTSVPGIYAAGDCCEGNNLERGPEQIIGLWANANHQGETAGINMAGRYGLGVKYPSQYHPFYEYGFYWFWRQPMQGEVRRMRFSFRRSISALY